MVFPEGFLLELLYFFFSIVILKTGYFWTNNIEPQWNSII